MAYRVWLEHDRRTLGCRIRLVAERICEGTGKLGAEELKLCIHALCGLYCSFETRSFDTYDLFNGRLREEVTEGELHEDTITAAIYLGICGIVKRYLKRLSNDCEYNSKDYCVYWRRHWIPAFCGNFEMVKLLLALDQPTEGDEREPIPKHCYLDMIKCSALGGHTEIFNFALNQALVRDYDFDMSHKLKSLDYEYIANAMLDTAFPSDYERLASIVGKCHMVFKPRNNGDMNARLSESAERGRTDMVRHFLDKGAWVNDPRAKKDYTPGKKPWRTRQLIPRSRAHLLSAIESMPLGIEPVVKLLLERGADPNWYSRDQTPLMLATVKNRLDLVRLLVDHGADVNDGNPAPIVLSVRKENTSIFKYLRENGATLRTPETGAWCMSEARTSNLDSMVALLIQEGVDTSAFLDRVPLVTEIRPNWHYRALNSDLELSTRHDI